MRRWPLLFVVGLVVGGLAPGAMQWLGAPELVDDLAGRLTGDEPTIHRWTSADGATPLRVSRHKPIVGEIVRFSGRLTTPVARPVILEAGGPEWSPIATGRSDSSGAFSLSAPARESTTQYRVRAPRLSTTENGSPVIYSWQRTTKRVLTPVKQAAAVEVAPAPVGQSAEGVDNLTPGTARFTPARRGRSVVVQRRASKSWVTVATSSQGAGGVAHFHVPPGRGSGAASYRVVARPFQGAPAAASAAVRVARPQPIWQDDFSGSTLDMSVWGYRHLGVRSEASQRLCAESSEKTVSVGGGRAFLRVLPVRPPEDPEHCPHGEFLNAQIGTQGTFSFTYGVMAARIKFPHQQGQHGAFWSQPADPLDEPGNPALTGAEIDVVEYFGDDFRNGALQHSVYWVGRNGEANKVGGAKDRNALLPPGKTWSNSFHVYSVEWTPEEYIFRVDGRQTFRTSRGVSKTPQYVILSLLTSDWELDKMDATKLNPMQVDWVRVWQP